MKKGHKTHAKSYAKHGKFGVAPYNKAERKMDRKAMKKARSETKRARKG